jgi:hypothetical protein
LIRHTRLIHGSSSNNGSPAATRNLSNSQTTANSSVLSSVDVHDHAQLEQNASDAVLTVQTPSHSHLRERIDSVMENQDSGTLSGNLQFQSFPENTTQVLSSTQHSSSNYDYQNSAAPTNQALDGQIDNLFYNNIIDGTLVTTGVSGMVGTPEYNLFLDDYNMPNFYLPAALFDNFDLPTSLWSQPDWTSAVGFQSQNSNREHAQNDTDPLSRFGSRLPSLQPEEQNPERESIPRAYLRRNEPPWKISGQDYREIQLKIAEFKSVLPEDFRLPSRHALSRFLEGYVSGFDQHLPFLHIPTFAVTRCVPELLLAICAVGAQYRFESATGNQLWYAARSVAVEQNNKRNSHSIAALKSPAPFRSSSSHHSPASGRAGSMSMTDQALEARSPQTLEDLR